MARTRETAGEEASPERLRPDAGGRSGAAQGRSNAISRESSRSLSRSESATAVETLRRPERTGGPSARREVGGGVSVSISDEARALFEQSRSSSAESSASDDDLAIASGQISPSVIGDAAPRIGARPARAAEGDVQASGLANDDEASSVLLGSDRIERDPVTLGAEESEAAAPGDAVSSSRFIAVRVGPAPLTDLSEPAAEVEVGPSESLNNRALLSVASQVLSLPETGRASSDGEQSSSSRASTSGTPQIGSAATGPATSASRGSGADRTERTGRERDDEDEAEPEALPGLGLETRNALETGRGELRSERAFAFEAERRGQTERPLPFNRSSDDRSVRSAGASLGQRLERDSAVEVQRPQLSSSDLTRVTSVASQTGALGDTRDTSREPTAASVATSERNSAGEAEPQIAQVGKTVEASAADAIVTRFLGNIESEDPGPVPRTREFIGQGSGA